ncbi:cation:proton antiporter regulatory subunit [Sphingobacterium psychroaquaticum]|uniref:Potassium/proton antiporter regulatory subunit, CPA2 family n=1 Tax=Sphingobacterium psychroaquaticum TaxID=561061 RepID=A0A1X7L5L7_9SPHI|nr:cation:proton antiporter regulatory subunit [Sphingobacterium psychroaquaticum]QBQ42312.1 potassium:proton antiporter [Sphingobacterium psychroaquaticum]SMG49166.1 potassium/proton antiporter regulatory subunit, CPA2 family [Sphingobacterium psychroaquaticum]
MSIVRETDLIGIGKKYQIETEAGDNMIVVIHDDGRRELYRSEDDDSETHCVMTLSDEESRQVAGILGGLSYKPKSLETIEVALDDLRIEWYKVGESSDGVNKSIGQLEVRQRTGASIIAAIQEDETVINPGPDYVITPGATLVIAGKKMNIKLLKEILI